MIHGYSPSCASRTVLVRLGGIIVSVENGLSAERAEHKASEFRALGFTEVTVR